MNRITTLLVGAMLVLSACSTAGTPPAKKQTSAKEPSQIQLKQGVHFFAPDGSAVVVQPGAYRVESVGDSQLRLVSSTGAAPILLGAYATPSAADVPEPVALGTLFESEVYHLVLLSPGNNALETHGSASGVTSRGEFTVNRAMLLKANKFVMQQNPPQPLPDLVPTCLRVEQINLGLTSLFFVHGGVTNQGPAAAGASQAKYASVTVPVSGLQPGQFLAVVFSFGLTSPPSAPIQVDPANQVAESNEQNNNGQQWCGY
jgi:CARDB